MTRCPALKHGRQCRRPVGHDGFHVYAVPRAWKSVRAADSGRRGEVLERVDGWCEARTVVCSGRATQVHHLLRRSQGGTDAPENLLGVCVRCHERIHSHPEWAYQVGLLHRSSTA